MIYCFNPRCKKPKNPDGTEICQACSSKLLLKERYRAVQFLGDGVFSRSFAAEDTQQRKIPCVIKQFAPLPQIQGHSEAMAKAMQVFEQEAKQLLELAEQYPQIPTLFDYFEQDKYLYVAKYYIEGKNLAQELQAQGAFSEHQVREFLYDVLPVLQVLHKRQLVHRAIKPTNIILKKSDRKFVLIDIGISKQLADTRLTKTNLRASTEVYTPIEQLRGGKAYPASDLYSLGVICIQMLTGAQVDDLYDPIEGRWMWREYIRNMGTDIGDSLAQIVDKMLQDSIKDRYQSASDILKEFYTGAIPRTTTSDRTKSSPQEPEKKAPRWQCIHTIAGHLDTVTTVAFSPIPPGPPYEGGPGGILATGSADNTVKIWQSDTGKLIRTFLGHSDTVNCIAFSPNDNSKETPPLIASGSGDKTIKIWQLDTGKLIHSLTGHSVTVFSIAFSPDGEMLASASGDGTIRLWHPGTGKLLNVLTGHSDFVESVAFSPSGDRIASGSWDNTIRIWQVSTGKLLHTIKGHSGGIWSVTFSPDGQTLASNSGDNTIKLWHPETGTLNYTLTENSDSAWSVIFSPDGQTLASDSGNDTIKIWHLPSRKVRSTLSGHLSQVRSIAFSRDGKMLATGSDDKTFKIWRFE
jgi:WD40 repeat protein